jgi:hypothetical protein
VDGKGASPSLPKIVGGAVLALFFVVLAIVTAGVALIVAMVAGIVWLIARARGGSARGPSPSGPAGKARGFGNEAVKRFQEVKQQTAENLRDPVRQERRHYRINQLLDQRRRIQERLQALHNQFSARQRYLNAHNEVMLEHDAELERLSQLISELESERAQNLVELRDEGVA